MRRGLFKLLAVLSVAAAVVFGIIDLIHGLNSGHVFLRPLGVHWLNLHEASLQDLYVTLAGDGPSFFWNDVVKRILSQPASAVFGCLAVFFLAFAMLFPSRHSRRRLYDDP